MVLSAFKELYEYCLLAINLSILWDGYLLSQCRLRVGDQAQQKPKKLL